MKLPANTPLAVSLRWSPTDVVRVGRLAFIGNKGVFEYDAAYVASGPGILPGQRPASDLVTAGTNSFNGLHGMFSDSLPDAWGRQGVWRVEAHNERRQENVGRDSRKHCLDSTG